MADAASRAKARGVKVPDYVQRRERLDPEINRFRTFRLFEGFGSVFDVVLRRARMARLIGDKEAARRYVEHARHLRVAYARMRD